MGTFSLSCISFTLILFESFALIQYNSILFLFAVIYFVLCSVYFKWVSVYKSPFPSYSLSVSLSHSPSHFYFFSIFISIEASLNSIRQEFSFLWSISNFKRIKYMCTVFIGLNWNACKQGYKSMLIVFFFVSVVVSVFASPHTFCHNSHCSNVRATFQQSEKKQVRKSS